jgi:hypothetical protein
MKQSSRTHFHALNFDSVPVEGLSLQSTAKLPLSVYYRRKRTNSTNVIDKTIRLSSISDVSSSSENSKIQQRD